MKLAQIDFSALESITFGARASFFSGGGSIGRIVTGLIPYVYTTAGILLLGYLIFGGYQIMMSGGNPKVVEAGKAKITYALLGFLLIFVSFWIVELVGLMLGIDVIGEIFG